MSKPTIKSECRRFLKNVVQTTGPVPPQLELLMTVAFYSGAIVYQGLAKDDRSSARIDAELLDWQDKLAKENRASA